MSAIIAISARMNAAAYATVVFSASELLVALLDQQRRGLGAEGDATGHDLDRAELTE